jgi:hypothetical protein
MLPGIHMKIQSRAFDTMLMNIFEAVKNSKHAKTKEKKNWN